MKSRNELRRKYKGKGYHLCKITITPPCDTNALTTNICNTPIRPALWITPTGRFTAKKSPSGRPLTLKHMCEVCYKEFTEDDRYKIHDNNIAKHLTLL